MNMDRCERAGVGRIHREDNYRYKYSERVSALRYEDMAIGIGCSAAKRETLRQIHARGPGPVRPKWSNTSNSLQTLHLIELS
jgi:hypothetical protein